MSRALHQAGPPLRYRGAVDAEGHILEELAALFPDDGPRRRFLGDNCRELFRIDA